MVILALQIMLQKKSLGMNKMKKKKITIVDRYIDVFEGVSST